MELNVLFSRIRYLKKNSCFSPRKRIEKNYIIRSHVIDGMPCSLSWIYFIGIYIYRNRCVVLIIYSEGLFGGSIWHER